MKNKILSIQSKLIYGYVGANIAELAIQLHGFDIISYPTVYLAAHTGHRPIYGTAIDPQLFADFVKGIQNLDILKDVSCAVSGYVGSMPILTQVTDYMKQLKEQYPEMLYVCDPVMGDVDTGLYVSEEVSNHIEHTLLPLCDVMTPNFFEFEHLTKKKMSTLQEMCEGVLQNELLCKKAVVVTSCMLKDTPKDSLETIIIANGTVKRICTKKIAIETTGTGDFFASLLSTQLASGKPLDEAVEYASKTVSKALAYTLQHQNGELNAASVLFSLTNYSQN